MTMLRPVLRSSALKTLSRSLISNKSRDALRHSLRASSATFATQSGDDAAPPVAMAKLYLEDGTELVGKSFGSHETVEGEVRYQHFKFEGG